MGGIWPNLILGGTPHAGVPTLHRSLDKHPSIFMCPRVGSGFFSRTWDRVETDADAFGEAERSYLDLFAEGRDQPVRGEASPGYFIHPQAPERIAETIPDARVVLALRDPVERAHAWWSLARARTPDVGAFGPLVERELERVDPRFPGFLSPGRYGTHLERWIEAIDRDRIRVVVFADLVEHRLDVFEEIADHVGVDPEAMAGIEDGGLHDPHRVPRNAVAAWIRSSERVARIARTVLPEEWRIRLGDEVLAQQPETPSIDPDARERLAAFYAPEIERAEELVGRDLADLRRTWDR